MIKNKRGEMLARDWVIILVLFGAVIGLASLFVADLASSDNGYNNTDIVNENFQSNYDTLTETSTNIYQMQNATSSGEGLSTTSTFTTTFKATFSVVSIVFGSFGIAKNTFSNFAYDFGVPSPVANIFFSSLLVIIIAIIIFVVISSVSQGKL